MEIVVKKQKLVILDKDGTLVAPVSASKFVQDPFDQTLLPGVRDRINELMQIGATLVIASNQGGVAAGYKSLESAIAEMHFAMKLISDAYGNFAIRTGYFCPDFDGKTCYGVPPVVTDGDRNSDFYGILKVEAGGYRKPDAGMLLLAMEQYSCSDAIMIGDRPEDADAASAAGIQFLDADHWRKFGVEPAKI
jgi:D-glycero-D-manno-heptose 1,7-bisphosphate phosphatase